MSLLLAFLLNLQASPFADAEAPAPLPEELPPSCVMADAMTPPPEEEAAGARDTLPPCPEESAPHAEAWAEEARVQKVPDDPSPLVQQIALDLMRSKAQSWRACTVEQARDMAVRSREPAETIATAAIALCAEEYRDMDIAAKEAALMFRGGAGSADRVASRHREDWRGSLLAFVIKWRQ